MSKGYVVKKGLIACVILGVIILNEGLQVVVQAQDIIDDDGVSISQEVEVVETEEILELEIPDETVQIADEVDSIEPVSDEEPVNLDTQDELEVADELEVGLQQDEGSFKVTTKRVIEDTQTEGEVLPVGTTIKYNFQLDTTGVSNDLSQIYLEFKYDDEVVNEEALGIDSELYPQVKGWTALDGIFTIQLQPLSEGEQVDIDIEWELKPFVTAKNTPYHVDLTVHNGLEGLHTEDDVFTLYGTYNDPELKVTANNRGDNEVVSGLSPHILYAFETSGLERHLSGVDLTVALPTYTTKDGQEQLAVMGDDNNEGWVYDTDRTHVTYTQTVDNTAQLDLIYLELTFPGIEQDAEVSLTVEGKYIPYLQGELEPIGVVEQGITSILNVREYTTMPETGTYGVYIYLTLALVFIGGIIIIQVKKGKK